MYNKVILVGNLTRDIEIRYTHGGAAIGNTGIAATRKFKAQTGEQREEVLFIDIAFFGRTAEIANQYLRKGSKVLVEGRLKLDQWTARDGSKRTKHSVTVESLQMLGNKDENGGNQGGNQGQAYGQQGQGRSAQPQSQTPQGETSESYSPQEIQKRSESPKPKLPEIDLDSEIPF